MKNIIFLESEKQMPLMKLPVRSTFVRVGTKGILISPGSCLSHDQLNKLDGVTDIVAPSLLHCAGVPSASQVFKNVKIWGPLNAKVIKPEIQWTHELTKEQWPYQDHLSMIQIEGMPKVNEVVFVHTESRSLIISDLCFNLTDATGMGSWIILKIFDTYRKLAVSRFFLSLVKDKIKFEKSLGELFSYDFDKIIVGHGNVVETSGKKLLLNALNDRGFRPK